MCRFLLRSSSQPHDPRDEVVHFARMCQHSHCLDGDWQGDGWGVAWWQDGTGWQRYRSVAPIWTEMEALPDLPPTRHLVVHARAASFPQHKGKLVYSQPYVWESYAFVFNGLIKGVRLPRKVPGSIGAAKIWHLVQEQLQRGAPLQTALQHVYTTLEEHSSVIQACNMGLSDGQTFAFYNGNPSGNDYYQLHQVHDGSLRMVCSEPFGTWQWQTAEKA